MTRLQVIVDTNLLDADDLQRLRDAAYGVELDIKTVTVNVRERGRESVPQTSEPFVLDETPSGMGLLASVEGASRFEAILAAISNRSFPPPDKRENLSRGQLRQLRDAMSLEAHARDARDVFISRDAKGFIDGGRRQLLEGLCSTRILLPEEFPAYCDDLRSTQASGGGQIAT